jgi:uncharacterized protein YeaO (DUF488 family)
MPIRIVRLGSPRARNEGLRLGTVRRPPRGVPRSEFARRDFYDLWFPLLSPSAQLMARAQAAVAADDDKAWKAFERGFRREMGEGEAARTLDLLAALSPSTDLAIGCYCEDERRCHRGVLRALLLERGASLRE